MLKVALVGCGTMGRTHSNAYERMPNVEVSIVCDIREDVARKTAALHGATSTTEFQTVLDSDVDMVDICLPTYLHAEFAIAAMKRKKHVFCEKPMAISMEAAKSMKYASEQNHVKLTVGHVLRLFPQYAHATEACISGKIGTPRMYRTVRNQGFPKWSWENWYLDYQKSGGPILDLLIHDIDWLISSFGRVDTVYAQTVSNDLSLHEQDHVQAILKLQNGSVAYSECSWALPQGSPFKMAYEVIGTEGQIEYDNTINYGLKLQMNESYYTEEHQIPLSTDDDPYYQELARFVAAIENDTNVFVEPSSALYSLRVALACVRSTKENRAVSMIEEEG